MGSPPKPPINPTRENNPPRVQTSRSYYGGIRPAMSHSDFKPFAPVLLIYTTTSVRSECEPIQDLDLFPIPERRIILPVNMKINYSTYVTLRVEDTLEASADSLVPEMMRINSGTDLAAMHVADQVCCCCCCCGCCSWWWGGTVLVLGGGVHVCFAASTFQIAVKKHGLQALGRNINTTSKLGYTFVLLMFGEGGGVGGQGRTGRRDMSCSS